MSDSNQKTTHTILHRIELDVSPEKVFDAVATPRGVAQWWTPMTKGGSDVGEIVEVRFGDGNHGPDMRIDETSSPIRILASKGPGKGISSASTSKRLSEVPPSCFAIRVG